MRNDHSWCGAIHRETAPNFYWLPIPVLHRNYPNPYPANKGACEVSVWDPCGAHVCNKINDVSEKLEIQKICQNHYQGASIRTGMGAMGVNQGTVTK